jgi:hypothetical protein
VTRDLVDGEEPPEGPLTDANLLDEAQVYRSMFEASQGRMGPRDVDALTMWEIATCLGVADRELGRKTEDDDTQDGAEGGDTKMPSQGHPHEYLFARMAHAADPENTPKPEARAVSGAAFTAITGSLGPVGASGAGS